MRLIKNVCLGKFKLENTKVHSSEKYFFKIIVKHNTKITVLEGIDNKSLSLIYFRKLIQ